jgi:hypothetical protein
VTVDQSVKLKFRLKNGETHEFTLPDDSEIHRAIIWVPKGSDAEKKEAANFIILPDDVETVEIIDDNMTKNARAACVSS